MKYNNETGSQGTTAAAKRPQVTSYDSCHEHSVEHWIELRLLVQFEEEIIVIGEPERAKAAVA